MTDAGRTTRTVPDEAQRCSRCDRWLLPREHTRERGICHSCWSQEMAYDLSEPESAPGRTSVVDGPPHDAEAQEGAASAPACRELYCLLAGWVLREASTPDSG